MNRKEKIDLLNSINNGTKSIEDLKQESLATEFLQFASIEELKTAIENDWTLYLSEFNIWCNQQKKENE